MCLSEQLNAGVAGRAWASLLPALPRWAGPPLFDRMRASQRGEGQLDRPARPCCCRLLLTGPAEMLQLPAREE